MRYIRMKKLMLLFLVILMLSGHVFPSNDDLSNDATQNADEIPTMEDSEMYDALITRFMGTEPNALNQKQLTVAALITFDAEMMNGGLCQFFANDHSGYAQYISDALEEIEDNAFRLCTSLERVVLGNDTVIGEEIFFGCSSLKSVRLPLESIYLRYLFEDYYGNGGVPATLKKVEVIGESVYNYALSQCTSVEEIVIGANVTKINVQAFSACTNLTSVEFESQTGWTMGGSAVDVSDAVKNAQNLKNGPAYTRTAE
jgi:hypothetical protein